MSTLSNKVCDSLYNIVTYCGKGEVRRIEFTDKGLEIACKVAFNGQFKPLSGGAVRMLMQCVNKGSFPSHTEGFSSSVVNELMEPWSFANAGAVLYPDEFQCWESDDEVFFSVDNSKTVGGNWICATYHADVAARLIMGEINKLKARIVVSEGLPCSVLNIS